MLTSYPTSDQIQTPLFTRGNGMERKELHKRNDIHSQFKKQDLFDLGNAD